MNKPALDDSSVEIALTSSPWPPLFAQRHPIVIDGLTTAPPPPEISFRHDESNEYRKHEIVFEAWVRSETINNTNAFNILLLANNDILARLWNETVSAEINICPFYFDTPLRWKSTDTEMWHLLCNLDEDGPKVLKYMRSWGWREDMTDMTELYVKCDLDEDDLKYLLWRCGTAVVPGMLRVAKLAPDLLCRVLRPVADARIVPLMVSQIKQGFLSKQWLLRHPSAVVHGLVPVAVGTPGRLRDEYEELLCWLSSHGHGLVIRDAAAYYGLQVSDAVTEILSVDRASYFHRQRLPVLPHWARVGKYQLPVDKDTGTPLSNAYLPRLFEMMSLSTYEDIYPPLKEIFDRFDRQSLAEFGWSIFQVWNGSYSTKKLKEKWMLDCQGYLADDTTISRLVSAIRKWPNIYGKRIISALTAIASIGSDAAILALYDFQNNNNRRSTNKLKQEAKKMLDDILLVRGLGLEQILDRAVPTFDLDKPETLQLNFGSRVFTIGINEKLMPSLYDHQGKKQKSLPKARKDDDATLAKAATEHWRHFRARLKREAANQLSRLEQAMLNNQRWSSDDFNCYLAGHPLLRYVVRSLIWCAIWDEQPECYFRINDNGDFIDAADQPVEVPSAAQIFLPHPIHMSEVIGLWKDSLIRHQIKQPFVQITRLFYLREDDTRQDLFAIQGAKAPAKAFRGLKAAGWNPGEGSYGTIWGYDKKIGNGTADISFDGIVTIFDEGMDEDQTLEVKLSDNLTRIEFSEVIREIKGLLH